MSATTRLAWLVAVVVIALPIAVSLRHHHARGDLYSGEAFAAFYCGGEAVRERRSPYLVEPLRACEARANVIPRGVVEPAPLPPVTLGFFALLSVLPYAIASALWALVLVASFVAAGACLVRLAPRVPPLAIWAALLPSVLYFNAYYGEVPALVVGALAVAGLALRSGRIGRVVAGATVAALFEPHVGGAAWLGVFLVAGTRGRGLLVLTLAFAALGSIVAVGFETVISYATVVLPAHAASEFPANDQYSLTSILYQLGIAGKPALLAGSVSYALALVLGLAGGIGLARRLGAAEFAVFFPAAAVLCGGTFIHNIQMGIAVPLAVAAANAAAYTRYRGIAYLGMLAGAVPEPGWSTFLLAFGAGAAFAVTWAARRAGGYGALVAGICGAVAYVAVFAAVRKLGAAGPNAEQLHFFATAFPAAPPGDVAEGSWTAYVTAVAHTETRGEWLSRVVQYVALLAGYVAAASPLMRGAARDDDSKETLPSSSVSQRVLT